MHGAFYMKKGGVHADAALSILFSAAIAAAVAAGPIADTVAAAVRLCGTAARNLRRTLGAAGIAAGPLLSASAPAPGPGTPAGLILHVLPASAAVLRRLSLPSAGSAVPVLFPPLRPAPGLFGSSGLAAGDLRKLCRQFRGQLLKFIIANLLQNFLRLDLGRLPLQLSFTALAAGLEIAQHIVLKLHQIALIVHKFDLDLPFQCGGIHHGSDPVRRLHLIASAGHLPEHVVIGVLLILQTAHKPPAHAGDLGGIQGQPLFLGHLDGHGMKVVQKGTAA